jgi:soluble lytic murein transglycosylase
MAPAAFPSGSLDHVTMMGESSGNPNAVSSKGARGLMQVMPETARDPGYGIRPSNGTKADDVRVGKEYRATMQSRYGGDLRKMWAAYNWGPGNLDAAIATHGENGWFANAPRETKNYIARNMRALGGR